VSHDNLIDKNASQTNIWNRWNFHYLSQFSWLPRADNPKENTSCFECLTTYLYLSLSWRLRKHGTLFIIYIYKDFHLIALW